MNKILFADLDGTLLDDEKNISEENHIAIQKMLEAGDYFVICTGRPVASGRIVAKELGLTSPGCYMICFNGAVVYDCSSDRILMQRSIPFHDVEKLFEKAKEEGIYIQTYNETDIVTLEHTKELDYYKDRTNISYKVVQNLFEALSNEPQKVLLIDIEHTGILEKFQNENANWANEHMNSFFSCEEYLEYCPKNIDKGIGVSYLAEFLNIPMENTFAVGDERNDIPMLQAAHTGVAMLNSRNEVKEKADVITTKDNNHSAIAELIHTYIL